jgi:iron complex outermembrane recepter protein
MRVLRVTALASVSVMSIAAPAFGQTAGGTAPEASAPAAPAPTDEILVMARRKAERLQDVPKSIEVVNTADLQKNVITNFQDVSQLTTGLTLQNANNGLVQNTEMRGINFDVNSGANPTVAFYWNDGGAQSNYIYQSMYDIGQIEVQKGPQGTLRGAAAPSGAITITTHKPDLYNYGGYVSGSIGTGYYGHTVDGAINVPIIAGKLAVRVAGMLTDNEGDGVRSANPALWPDGPFNRSWSGRISVRFVPTDTLEINAVYQRVVSHDLNYQQTESTCLIDSSVSCANPDNGTAYYGVITANQRLSTVAEPRTTSEQQNMFNLRADWHVLGQKLSYVGQYALQHLTSNQPYDFADLYNSYYSSGFQYYDTAISRNQNETNEVRLASDERIAGIFDYVVGFYALWSPTNNYVSSSAVALPAAYAAEVPYIEAEGLGCTNYTVAYNCAANLFQFGNRTEHAVFGNVTAHLLGDKLELSGGLRHLWDANTSYFFGNALSEEEEEIASAVGPVTSKAQKTIWAASASYHFTSDIMGYISGGSSFRQGLNSVGPFLSTAGYGGISTAVASAYGNMQNETSTSYEAGFKTTFAHHRGIFNLTYYHQTFQNYQWASPSYVWVYTNAGVPVSVSGFVASVPVKVDGIEAEAGYRLTPELNTGASFSYADGRITGNALTPCNGPDGAGSVSAATPIYTCAGGPSSYLPRWKVALHGDFTKPIDAHKDGYIRVQGTINPGSIYYSALPYNTQRPYSTFNLFFGVKAHDGRWDLSAFFKNLFDKQTALAAYGGNIPTATAGSANSAYNLLTMSPPRQIGLSLRVAVGQ